jgi:alkanesulfonate monooxygenase SsuD/methylene tetrahydromethanopterin reductase-like flavin-dependent oxidoreductase (luciferase family)
MRFGVFLLAGRFPGQTDAEALGRAADAVGWAEEAGFDDAWIAEHHFMSYGVCPSAITFAAHALARTSRITVGTAVAVLSTAHPVQVAEQARMLSAMSGGRFHLGVGRGGPWRDLEVFGTGLYRWERGFGDGMRLLMDSLTKDTVGSTGRFAFRAVPMVPQAPPPPVTVACTSPGTVELAAELGLPMLLGMDLSPARKARRRGARARGTGRGGPGDHARLARPRARRLRPRGRPAPQEGRPGGVHGEAHRHAPGRQPRAVRTAAAGGRRGMRAPHPDGRPHRPAGRDPPHDPAAGCGGAAQAA